MDSEDLVRDPYPPSRRGSTWQCRTCGYKPNLEEHCVNCGRDWFGTDPGPGALDQDEKPHRPGLR